MAVLPAREIPAGCAGKSQAWLWIKYIWEIWGSEQHQSFHSRRAGGSVRHPISHRGSAGVGFFAVSAGSLLAYSTSVLIILPSVRVIGDFSTSCLGIWRKGGWFGWWELCFTWEGWCWHLLGTETRLQPSAVSEF